MRDIKNELRELKLDLNEARRVGDKSQVIEIQERINGLEKK